MSINSFMYIVYGYILKIFKNIAFKKLLSNFRTKAFVYVITIMAHTTQWILMAKIGLPVLF